MKRCATADCATTYGDTSNMKRYAVSDMASGTADTRMMRMVSIDIYNIHAGDHGNEQNFLVQMNNLETSNTYDRVQLVYFRLNGGLQFTTPQHYHFSEGSSAGEALTRSRKFYDIKSYPWEDGMN